MCLCAAYVTPFDHDHDHLNVDNTSCFVAIESVLLDVVDIVTGSENILCGDFNARTADRSCLTISFDHNDEEGVFEHKRWSQDTKTNISVIRCYVIHVRLRF